MSAGQPQAVGASNRSHAVAGQGLVFVRGMGVRGGAAGYRTKRQWQFDVTAMQHQTGGWLLSGHWHTRQHTRRHARHVTPHLSPTMDAISTSSQCTSRKGRSQRDCRQEWTDGVQHQPSCGVASCCTPKLRCHTLKATADVAAARRTTEPAAKTQQCGGGRSPDAHVDGKSKEKRKTPAAHLDASVHQQGAELQDVEQGAHQQAHVQHLRGGWRVAHESRTANGALLNELPTQLLTSAEEANCRGCCR